MIFDTLIFFLITFTSLISFIGYGIITDKLIFKSSIKETNQFKFFFLSLIVIVPLSFLYIFTISNNNYFNLLFFCCGLFFYFFFYKQKNLKLIFITTFLFFIGLLISKTHEDFTSYHFQHLREISNDYLIFGLANLDERYFYSSIYSYVQVFFKLGDYDLDLIHIPIYLIYLSLIGYLWSEISTKKKSFLLSILFFLIIVKFKRLSEFGYDFIGQFLLLYIFFEYLFKKNISKEKNTKLLLIYLVTILIKVSNLYFFPLILFFLISKKKISELFYFRTLIIFFLLFSTVFSTNSYLKTGCINYLIKETCGLSKDSNWNLNYDKIENSKKVIKNWSRGFYHQKQNKLSEKEYNKNFNWLHNWLDVYGLNKIGKLLLIFIVVTFFLKIFIFKNKFYRSFDIKILIGIILSLLIWLINFPPLRFGFAGIIIFLLLITQSIVGETNVFNKKNFIIFLIISIAYFNISNANRIFKEFNRNDLYRFNDFPWYAKPKLNYKIDNSNNFIFVRSAKNENFWTTCFNAPNICANHDKKLEFKLIGKRLFIYDLSK